MSSRGSQESYNSILRHENALERGLSQVECEQILTNNGFSYEQAKNGAYVYLHHNKHLHSNRRGSSLEYRKLLDAFRATEKTPKECISHLEEQGFSYRQSQTAVYNYRKSNGLINH